MSAALIIVAEWPKNERETVRVALDEFNGHPVVNARLWFRADDGSMRPGKAGLAIGVRHLPALAKALNQALAIATAQGLLPEEASR
ncbi:MAG: transcriptional coactivator p15/PC4 family protein [Bosea sp.]|uniref:transcriptional coactivator p15/PC4 family protein n=1 Tax=Bosea sp. (in: a-proteobacteria) TaxID=1871050 RepID=UPI001ACDC71D|nr:transcriptional coactivator p15/PC4 family protein [Bosea sp. (in: a-proteobacteria)]MBN9454285.1 transcriptional coactivator p15/PC4 family protein [Bosea sp. (in: a-proteobacteria)]